MLLDAVLGLIDGAANVGAWRPLICVFVAAPPAGILYVAVSDHTLASWLTGATLGAGLMGGLIWEWKAGADK